MKSNGRSVVMKQAWVIFRSSNGSLTFSEALKTSWALYKKENPIEKKVVVKKSKKTIKVKPEYAGMLIFDPAVFCEIA